MLIVMPFFQGDLLGMADEALNGQTGLGTLVSEGKTNYIRLLLGYLALFAVNLVLAVAAIVYVVVLAILGAFYATYSVTFYRSIEQTTHST